jgi:3-hydroxyisobutyrate dehydrogenase
MGQPMARNPGLPLLDVCHTLHAETAALGHGQSDMAAIIRAIESRTEAAVSAGRRP